LLASTVYLIAYGDYVCSFLPKNFAMRFLEDDKYQVSSRMKQEPKPSSTNFKILLSKEWKKFGPRAK
jgi:hypothetical protein